VALALGGLVALLAVVLVPLAIAARHFPGAFTVLWLSFLASQALSWRRSAGERRQQLKWLLSGAVVCLVSLAVSLTLGSFPGIWQVLSNVFAAGVVALPAAIGVGILKYRLYDIDRIISRTLA
jgi:two-component system, NarL family, sensor kinase